MITLRLPAGAAEHMRFELSPLAELMHSWHVLACPEHHALQLPWVRRARALPDNLRADLRKWSWVVRDEVPAAFLSGTGALVGSFADELDRVAELPDDLLLPAGGDPSPVLDLVQRYWRAGFAEEWRHLEPRLLDAVGDAGSALPDGVLPVLGALIPDGTVGAESFALDLPPEHRIDVAERGPLRLTPSFFAWPHVRLTYEEPWPLRLTFPVVPGGRSRRAEPATVLTRLRALAAQPRLDILRLLRERPRSTQELSGLLGMSGAATSRHLRQLLSADLVRTQREGYFVLYRVAPRTLDELAAQLTTLG